MRTSTKRLKEIKNDPSAIVEENPDDIPLEDIG